MLADIEKTRLAVTKQIDRKKRATLGQFFTPITISRFMANLFEQNGIRRCRLLDAGAGIGSLVDAFLEKCSIGDFNYESLQVDAFEIDCSLRPYLEGTINKYRSKVNFVADIRFADFIHTATDWLSESLFSSPPPLFTHAILNPPYKKIRSDSEHRLALRRVNIETVNLYSAFVALALALLEEKGQLVAIIPRSFCNGPYYSPFREYILSRSAIKHIHLFESRSKAFKEDDVLQENIIIKLECGVKQGDVCVSTSTDDSFNDLSSHKYAFAQIVLPDDPGHFIHVPTSPDTVNENISSLIHYSLSEIGINVSTGPVVDFRLKEHLRDMPEPGTVPLLYPGHFKENGIEWPKIGLKKPNAIKHNVDTERWLYPNGAYCLVRRFSSKEERRRVVARAVDSTAFPNAPLLGFENHLNLYHENKCGLPRELAYGLAVYLNSTGVDESFRLFNGHTQVNATDLKLIKYPSRDALMALGAWALKQGKLTQAMIDRKMGSLFV